MHKISQQQIITLHIILEDMKNHLTIIGGLIQISSEKEMIEHQNIINDSIDQFNILIDQAISILNEARQ